MTKWMDIAWAEQGQHEVSGSAANPRILGYFKDAGRPDITSDEIPWCAAFAGRCLQLGGVPIDAIPDDQRLRARAYASFGTAIDAPRVGALCVLSRGSDPSQGHVGFVVGWTDDSIALLGGNQSDSVNVSHFSRNRIVALRWPAPEATAGDLRRAGSTTMSRGNRQIQDGSLTGLINNLPVPPKIPSPQALAEKATAMQGLVETAIGFAAFAQAKWPWVIGGASLYLVARMVWDAYAIRQSRLADHNTGANQARSTTDEVADAEA